MYWENDMHYNLLILAMSCNEAFFTESRFVTHDTWVKDVIDGIYEGIGFYSYTSSETGEEYVENNTIYLNCSDEINGTYYKTIRCFEFLRENNITFDYVLRTNTSVYFNIPLTVQMINKNILFNFDLYSHSRGEISINMDDNSFRINEFHGSFYIATSKFIYILVDNYDTYNERNERVIGICSQVQFGVVGYDDITMNAIRFLLKYDGVANFTTVFDDTHMPRYKCVPKSKMTLKHEFNIDSLEYLSEQNKCIIGMTNTESPDVINYIPFIQYRLLTSLNNRKSTKYRYIELEHAYDLHESCKYVHNHTPFI